MNARQQEVYGCITIDGEWITQKQLLKKLNDMYGRNYKPRALRQIIKECRMLYKESKVPLLIIKSNRGYKLSKNYEEIERFVYELIKTGESMVNEGKELLDRAKQENEDITENCCGIEEYFKECITGLLQNGVFSYAQENEIKKCINADIPFSKIRLLADSRMHPYQMFLIRKGLLESLDEDKIILYADYKITPGDAYKLYHAATSGYSIEAIKKMKKEMRDVEIQKTNKD